MAGSKGRPNFIRALLPPAFWLGAWQLAAWLVELHVEGRGNELLLPYPLTVLAALAALVGQVSFWASVGATFLRVAAACSPEWCWADCWPVLPAPAPGLPGSCPRPSESSRATPVVSFILLVLLWTQRDPGTCHHLRPYGSAGYVGEPGPRHRGH